MNIFKLTAIAVFALFALNSFAQNKAIDRSNFDTSVKPGEDFYRYVNGGWMRNNPIPSEYSRWGSFDVIYEDNKKVINEILNNAVTTDYHPEGSNLQKLAIIYRTALDSAKQDREGLGPIAQDLQMIENIRTISELQDVYGQFMTYGSGFLFGAYSGQDDKSSKDVVLNIGAGGLSLPDRDYYFKDDEKSRKIREEYIHYISRLFEISGDNPADARMNAQTVFAIEKRLAEVHLTRVERRDPAKRYNKFTVSELKNLTPGIDWDGLFTDIGVNQSDLVNGIIVSQPKYLQEVDKMWSEVPVAEWKKYYKFKLLNSSANVLNSDLRAANWNFFERTMSGSLEPEPRWKYAQSYVQSAMGEALGQLFVEKKFSPAAKEKALKLVANIREALGERIQQLDWMSDATKQKALEKLSTFKVKIGYPDTWRDYSTLNIHEGSLASIMREVSKWNYKRNIAKLNRPVEDEWFMTPQIVNAYYSASKNEIVFPAGILQPPFFDENADDAVNYGGIGAVIGHEITHGFDDQGRKYDAYGNLTDWWTEEDAQKYTERADKIASQFNEFVAIDTFRVNGKLTLGENIADLGGLTIAYLAFKKTPQYKNNEVIDGFTPAQRFFINYAQVWRQNMRDEELLKRLSTDSHSPGYYRVLGPLANMEEFWEAFGLKEGDAMVRAADRRARIW